MEMANPSSQTVKTFLVIKKFSVNNLKYKSDGKKKVHKIANYLYHQFCLPRMGHIPAFWHFLHKEANGDNI